MKRFLCAALCLLLCLTIASCRQSEAPPEENSSRTEEAQSRLVDDLPPPKPDVDGSSAANSSHAAEASSAENHSQTDVSTSSSKSSAPSSSEAPAPSSSSESSRKIVKITFPEGKTFAQMAEMLEAKGVCTKQQLLDTVNSYDYSYYPLIAAQPGNAHRCFRLEGYLFPATYEFYTDMKPQDVLGKFLRASEQRITQEDRNRAAQLGYSMDQILTIASLIQGEAGNPDQIKKVSSVIHNRLKAGMKLQMDASINYVERSIKPYITGDKNRYNSYYNTYKCSGLPAGPICNPGKQWITAALYPADTDYLYFVNDKHGNYYFASTYKEHKANCEKAGFPIS
ncbi:MAG: endolytic transglycosylase MltG [Clostridiales bacterium]|nr:endolytic transglycosylase MltG [Clostridiales bacterium]